MPRTSFEPMSQGLRGTGTYACYDLFCHQQSFVCYKNLDGGCKTLQKIVICLNVCRLLRMGVSWPFYTASIVPCCREEFI